MQLDDSTFLSPGRWMNWWPSTTSRARRWPNWVSNSACTTARLLFIWRSVPIRRRGLNERHLAEAADRYASGLTLLEVGHRFDVGQQPVRQDVAAEGSGFGHRSARARK